MMNKSIQKEDETLELISKNDLMTLSLENYMLMIIDLLKYNNSLYMTFLAIEQHIFALSDEEQTKFDYLPYFIFLCCLLFSTGLLCITKYQSYVWKNVFESSLKRDNTILKFKQTASRISMMIMFVLLICGYMYIAYYHLIYKSFDKTRLFLFFVMGTGIFSFFVSINECFNALNSYKQVQSFDDGPLQLNIVQYDTERWKKVESSNYSYLQMMSVALIVALVQFYIIMSMAKRMFFS